MNQAAKFKQCYDLGYCLNGNDDFVGDTSNVIELFHRQILLESLQIALVIRNYDPSLLNYNDGNWFYDDIWLGKNLKDAYRWITDWW